jgi:hypothetical protein
VYAVSQREAGLGGPVSRDRGAVPLDLLRAGRHRTYPDPGRIATPVSEDDEDLAPIVTLDLRAIRTRLEEADGDLIMLVDDGDVQVEFGSGLCGTWEQAILGAQRVASTALAFAEALRERRPTGSGAANGTGNSTGNGETGVPPARHAGGNGAGATVSGAGSAAR